MPKPNRPIIPEETARLCEAILRAQMNGDPHPTTDVAVTREQAWTAKETLKLFQTQERFSPETIDTLMTRNHPSQNVRELAALTEESLADLNARLAADYPGKPS